MADTEQVTPEQTAPERAEPTKAARKPAAPGQEPASNGEQPSVETSAEGAAAVQAVAGGAEDAEAEHVLQGDVNELVATAAKRDEYLALAQRTQADFENYRKRVARDLAVAQERGVTKLARELLPALDNLDRALEAAEPGDPLLEGVRLVRAELTSALGRVGIESFVPAGELFDPGQHEAIAQQPFDGIDSGKVAEVYQPGYRCNGTVIRPARVVVAA